MTFYYLYGLAEGRSFRAGPFNTEREASSRGIEFCGSNFEIFPLDTKDSAEAGRRIKYILATRGKPINDALQRQRINKPNEEASQVYKEQNERQYREL